jgi:flagellar motor component MotA
MDQESIEDLVKVFQSLDEEKQDEIMKKVEKKDKAGAKFLKRIQRMQKRGRKIQNIKDKIEEKFS